MPAVITQAGALNTTALIVPNAYIQIIPPSTNYFNGVPTNIVGVVGTAQWGPVNVPQTISGMASYAQIFGAVQARKYDMGTGLATAVQQGANNFRCVRVTDGTDTAATLALNSVAGSTETVTISGTFTAADTIPLVFTSAAIVGSPLTITYTVPTPATGVTVTTAAAALTVLINASAALVSAGFTATSALGVVTITYPTSATTTFACVPTGAATEVATRAAGSATSISGDTLTSIWTGTLGNSAKVTVTNGSSYTAAVPTYKFTIAMPGVQEIFDNIGGAGGAVWTNFAAAINNGQSALRGPSRLVVASAAGLAVTAPVLGTFALAGGTDGVVTITASVLVGANTVPYTGMYALQNAGVSVAWLHDADDNTQWAAQLAFGVTNGIYMIGVTPVGDTISSAVTAKQTAGLDSPWWCHLFGDWIYWQDTANNVLRLVSPQGFKAGLLGNLAPQNSTLNKPLFGIVGTQKTSVANGQNGSYAAADLQNLITAGIDVIANPCPGGNYFGCQSGHNSSSDPTRRTDAYTRLTDYIGQSLGAATGKFVGQLQTRQQQINAKAALAAFFQSLQDAGQIGTSTGAAAYNINLPGAQSSASRVALGYEDVDIQVTYLAVIEFFLVNFQGGASVFIPPQSAVAS
jgi:hypothetical protein